MVRLRPVMMTALVLTTLFATTYVIVSRGFRPIRALAESAARFGRGDFSVRMAPTKLVEIAPAVEAFNRMASDLERVLHQLKEREAELAARSAVLHATLENIDQGLLAVDGELRMVAWNQNFLDLQSQLEQDVAYAFLYHTPDEVAFYNYVKGYRPIPEMRYLESVWLDQ